MLTKSTIQMDTPGSKIAPQLEKSISSRASPLQILKS
jgi:hypothetical protein